MNILPNARRRFRGGRLVALALVVLTPACMFSPALLGQESKVGGQEPTGRELNRAYAATNLQLARIELQLAEEFNREIASLVQSLVVGSAEEKARLLASRQLPATTLERLKADVAVAEEQLRQAESPSEGGAAPVLLRYAEEKLRLAKVQLDAATAATSASAVRRGLELKRAQLKYKLSELQLLMLKNPDQLLGTVESLYLKTDQLNEALVALERRLAALEEMAHRHRN